MLRFRSSPALHVDASDLLLLDAPRDSTAVGARTGPGGPVASPAGSDHVAQPTRRGRGGDIVLRFRFLPATVVTVVGTTRKFGGGTWFPPSVLFMDSSWCREFSQLIYHPLWDKRD